MILKNPPEQTSTVEIIDPIAFSSWTEAIDNLELRLITASIFVLRY